MAKTITGTDKADTIVVKSKVTVNAGKGNDLITVKGGSSSVINGQDGDDTISIESTAGSKNVINGDAGKDYIGILGGKKNEFYGGASGDTDPEGRLQD